MITSKKAAGKAAFLISGKTITNLCYGDFVTIFTLLSASAGHPVGLNSEWFPSDYA